MRLVLGFLALAVVATAGIFLGLSWASGSERTSWDFMSMPSDVELEIGVAVGGCDSFDRIETVERPWTVIVKAYIKHDHKNDCDLILYSEAHIVRLDAPLGDRTVQGCNPSSSVYSGSFPPDDDCLLQRDE